MPDGWSRAITSRRVSQGDLPPQRGPAAARRLEFDQHFFAINYLRALAGLALERRDMDTAEHLTEQVLHLSEPRRPLFEFLALLDQARIRAGPRAVP